MGKTYKSIFKRYNGTDWDTYYFATRADQVAEITTAGSSKVFETIEGRTAVNTYLLSGFNADNQLLKFDGNSAIGIKTANIASAINMNSTSAINMNLNRINFGTGTPTTANIKWSVRNSGPIFRLEADTGSGLGLSVGINAEAVDISGKRLQTVGTPVNASDGATKEYVDNLVAAGFSPKDPVMAASTANVNTEVALASLDGRTLAANDRVLLKNQTVPAEIGVYQLNASKVPVKVPADSGVGSSVFVEHGTSQNDYIFVSTTANNWVVFSRVDTVGVITSGGLEKSGNNIGIKANGITDGMVANYALGLSKIAGTVGNDLAYWNTISSAATSVNLDQRLNDIMSAIKRARGTSSYVTDNEETISGAYYRIGLKASTYRGDSAPSSTGYSNGDLYFQGAEI